MKIVHEKGSKPDSFSLHHMCVCFESKLSICLKYFHWFFDVDIIPNQKVFDGIQSKPSILHPKIILIKKSFQLLNYVSKSFFFDFQEFFFVSEWFSCTKTELFLDNNVIKIFIRHVKKSARKVDKKKPLSAEQWNKKIESVLHASEYGVFSVSTSQLLLMLLKIVLWWLQHLRRKSRKDMSLVSQVKQKKATTMQKLLNMWNLFEHIFLWREKIENNTYRSLSLKLHWILALIFKRL